MSEELQGSIKISDDVIATIASTATLEVDGVAGMSAGIAGEIYEFIGKKNPARGIKIVTSDTAVTVDVYIIVDYGIKIHEVAGEVQQRVKTAIEEMTGLNAECINVHIQGVKIAKEADPVCELAVDPVAEEQPSEEEPSEE